MSHCFNVQHTALGFSMHAIKRARQRGIPEHLVAHVMRFGRKQFLNQAIYYSVGRKEIKKYLHLCPALQHMNGLHLIMSRQGTIITMFRNRNFKLLRQG